MNRRAVVVGAVASALVLGLAWWLVSPLLLDRSVDEALPQIGSAEVPDNMTATEVAQVMAGMAKIEEPVGESMPPAANRAAMIKHGVFRDIDRVHRGSGTASIYRLSDGSHLLRFEDFRVTNGPQLHVLLTSHPDPMTRHDVHTEPYVDLGRLKGNVGNQNYSLPNDLDAAAHQSVVIYCKPFRVIFSVAPLQGM